MMRIRVRQREGKGGAPVNEETITTRHLLLPACRFRWAWAERKRCLTTSRHIIGSGQPPLPGCLNTGPHPADGEGLDGVAAPQRAVGGEMEPERRL